MTASPSIDISTTAPQTSDRHVSDGVDTRVQPWEGDPGTLTVEDRLAEAAEVTDAEREEILAEVIVDQLPLARSIAARYRDRGEPLEDLVQVASMALVMAVKRYRPGHGVSFSAFAVPTITGELRRHFRDHGWSIRPPRRVQELRPRLRQGIEDLTQELHRPPSVAELAEHLDVPAEEILETQSATTSYHNLSLDGPVRQSSGDDVSASLSDTVGAPDDGFELVVERVSAAPLLASLSERDQRVLALRYLDGCTQQQIADEIGVTQMQVSRLLSRSLQRLQALAAQD
ncbi:MAG TPA: SigB/SigF/SigG family RNA polymerase sigma factor [Segeticoccus sp.]|uniref:SigB/SigF/SigG family RNA polymerase sigma factor n=1 Tax=Segeticoccus sp. TaxID=2706531 RepID=UPI002D800741|nr:SigB/SigF/SigG family RNA polymerase sigma factor [Segeticoccus sp.]HET8598912.1 SigB/SigF/SigG family RNA polymerase sigma factor [Segeticoccus sp.]